MNFDRLAPAYRAMEFLLAGGVLQRMRRRWMPALADCADVLIAGDGHGRGAELVLHAAPQAQIVVVEASAGMIGVARRRLRVSGADRDRIHWVHADLRTWRAPEARFDAIVTQFFLDCFAPESLAGVVHHLGLAARREACWLLCDFRVPEHGWRRRRAQAIHALMYGFFRATVGLEARRLTAPDDALRAAGFCLEGRETASAGLLHTDLWRRSHRGRVELPPVGRHR